MKNDMPAEVNKYVNKLMKQDTFPSFKKAIRNVFNAYQIYGLLKPPEGINRKEFPMVSMKTNMVVLLGES